MISTFILHNICSFHSVQYISAQIIPQHSPQDVVTVIDVQSKGASCAIFYPVYALLFIVRTEASEFGVGLTYVRLRH